MDLRELGSKLGLDENEFKELVIFFLDSATSDIQKFRSACQKGDGAAAEASAHSLKGAAGNLGFLDIYELSKKAETDSRNSNFDECETVSSMIEEKIEQIKKSF